MNKGFGQVFVYEVWRNLLHLPRQTACQDGELVEVAGPPSDSVVVASCKFQDAHLCSSEAASAAREGGFYPKSVRSSIGYGRAWAVLIWAANRRWPILRAAYLTALTLCVYLSAFGNAITLLVLGQFGRAFQAMFEDPMDR